MAKETKVKGKLKKEVSCCDAPCVGNYKPTLYLSLEGKDTGQIKGVAVGEKVQILVEGTVKGVSQNERSGCDGEKTKHGSIDLEGYSVKVLADEDNEFLKMAEDDA